MLLSTICTIPLKCNRFKIINNTYRTYCFLRRLKTRNSLRLCYNLNVIFISKLPYSSSIKNDGSVSSYDPKDYLNFKPSLKNIREILCKLFNITVDTTNEIIDECPTLIRTPPDVVAYNFEKCKEAGINNEVLKKYSYILIIPKNTIQSRIRLIENLKVDINTIAPLLQLGVHDLLKINTIALNEANEIPGGNRILYLGEKTQTPPLDVAAAIGKHPFAYFLPFHRIEHILNILEEKGVDLRDVWKDVWVFRYRPKNIEMRLDAAVQNNIKPIKTWMVRCQTSILITTINRQHRNRELLGKHPSSVEYLSEKLEISYESAKFIMEKYPEICKMNIPKMKEMLDFLYKEGFTPSQVARWPRVLCSKFETIQTRVKQLKSIGYVPRSLVSLCKCKKQYDKHWDITVKKMGKDKKTNE